MWKKKRKKKKWILLPELTWTEPELVDYQHLISRTGGVWGDHRTCKMYVLHTHHHLRLSINREVTPPPVKHRHWSSWWDKGGTKASAACDWTSGACFMQVQEACSKFSSWMGRLRSVSWICDTAGSEEKATNHGKNDLNLDVTCYQKAAASLVLLFTLPLRR